MRHIFLINPAAGKTDRTQQYKTEIDALCEERHLDYEIFVSEKAGDCRDYAKKSAQTGDEIRLYACGGDGTLNEVISGAVGFGNAAVTHWPGGSGNDMVKNFSEPSAFCSLNRLLSADEMTMDVIRCNGRYAADILSIGIDARVGTGIAKFKRLPFVTGKGAYVLSIVYELLHGISAHYVVEINGERIDEEQTMVCVCNGRWYGGGFNPVPEAELDDGILDVLLVKKVGLLKVPGIIGDYQKGKYAEHRDLIRHMQCSSLRIICDRESIVNLDGEILRTADAEIELLPKALRFFYPEGLSYRHEVS